MSYQHIHASHGFITQNYDCVEKTVVSNKTINRLVNNMCSDSMNKFESPWKLSSVLKYIGIFLLHF